MEITETTFKIIVQPNAKENKILGFNKEKRAYKILIKARPEDNKANKEIIRFLSKELGKRVIIKSGLTSREKMIQVLGT